MRAIQISEFGAPGVLLPVDLPEPRLEPGQARVRVEAAGVNFIEAHMRTGAFPLPLPIVLGGEVVGVVDAVGDGVTTVQVGDRVAAPLFLAGGFGGYAELAALDASLLIKLPPNIDAPAASALMSQGYTAFHLARLFPAAGMTVFVHAAAGGVGSLLVQLLKRQGAAKIVAGASAGKHELVRRLGADLAVDYWQPNWDELVRASTGEGVDIIFDAAGDDVSRAGLGLLGLNGRVVAFGAPTLGTLTIGPAELAAMSAKNQSLHAFSLMPLLASHSIAETMEELMALVQKGELQVEVGASYPLEQAAQAHADLEARRTHGKIILTP